MAFSGMLRRVALVKRRLFLQEPNGVTSQKTPFFLVTAVKTSNLAFKIHLLLQLNYLLLTYNY
jgi:hypothetical protein